MKVAAATFSGKTGSYQFEVHPNETRFEDIGAVYVFTKRTVDSNGTGWHSLLYIGQTDALGQKLLDHEEQPCPHHNGMNCICVHRDDDETSRLAKEADLLAAHRTPCNAK